MKKIFATFAAMSLTVLAGCQTIVTTPPANCLDYIPPDWKKGVAGVLPSRTPALTAEDEAREAWKAYLAQTGQLSIANGRYADTIWIVEKCEANANDARPRKKFLGIF